MTCNAPLSLDLRNSLQIVGPMKDFLLEYQLRKIEQEVNNDFLQIMEAGPEYYSTQELHTLLGQLHQLRMEYQLRSRRMFYFGASVTLWISLSFLLGVFKLTILSYLFLALAPVTIIIYLVSMLILRWRYRVCRDGHLIESIIRQEIDRRRKDASIF